MSAYFARSYLSTVKYRDSELENKPVNLALCMSISKEKYAHYPDNIGRPSIKFLGCDTEWVYETDEQRDKDWQYLLECQR